MNKNFRDSNKKYEGFLEGISKMAGLSSVGAYALPSVIKRDNLTKLSGPPYKEGSIAGAMTGSIAGGLAIGAQLTSYFIPEFQSHGYEALGPLAWTNGASLAIETGTSVYNKAKKFFKKEDVSSKLEESVENGRIEKKAS